MLRRAPIRLSLAAILAGLLCCAAPALAQRGRRFAPPPRPFRADTLPPRDRNPNLGNTTGNNVRRAPLGSGLEALSKLPPGDREQALRDDPNFQKLPPERQQRMLNNLRRLNAMTPVQQQRMIQRLHDLGELNPRQRAGLEQIFQQFQQMPPERRRAFRAAYNNLRQLPPEQREMRMSRPLFQQRFSPDELKSLHQALDLNLPTDVVGARPNGGL